jgi:hypothetical protein
MNWQCFFGRHIFEETGMRKGVYHYEVICTKCDCRKWLHLVHDIKLLSQIRQRTGKKPIDTDELRQAGEP